MQVAGGINRYFSNLISRLPAEAEPLILTREQHKTNWPRHPRLKVEMFGGTNLKPAALRRLAYRRRISAFMRREQPDLVHPTYYMTVTAQDVTLYRRPLVVTVYDMIHEVMMAGRDTGNVHGNAKRNAVLAADAVICISEHTRKDLLEHYRVPEERIVVTPMASEIDVSMAEGRDGVPDAPYFLFVGSRGGYKNFSLLLDAFARVAGKHKEVRLLAVGPAFSAEERRRLSELSLDGRVDCRVHVDDRQLAGLYRHSVAFVCPSLYEGFGIPLVEAMACGTPVVASNRTSIPEVVGEAGILFDPSSAEELAGALTRLLSSGSERERLIEKGYRRAKMFSWEKTALKTYDVYRSLA